MSLVERFFFTYPYVISFSDLPGLLGGLNMMFSFSVETKQLNCSGCDQGDLSLYMQTHGPMMCYTFERQQTHALRGQGVGEVWVRCGSGVPEVCLRSDPDYQLCYTCLARWSAFVVF